MHRILPVRGTHPSIGSQHFGWARTCPGRILFSSPSGSQVDRLLSAGQFQGLRSYLLGVEGKGKPLFGQS